MKQFVITMRVLKEFPSLDTACAEVNNLPGVEQAIDITVEELTPELAESIIADHEEYEELDYAERIEGIGPGKVLDFIAAKNRRLDS